MGRSIFVTELRPILTRLGPIGMARQASTAHVDAVWIRIGRGAGVDPNLSVGEFDRLRAQLASAGIALWGWHVPFCKDARAVRVEVAQVVATVDSHGLNGIVVDAERTGNSRFIGTATEADLYASTLAAAMAQRGLGIAFSSHDQPPLHADLPFASFLKHIAPACPQIYNVNADPAPRFARSEDGYRSFLGPAMTVRFQPTANACTRGDIVFPNAATCLASLGRFLDLVATRGYVAHSIWCWDDAPDEMWEFLTSHPSNGAAHMDIAKAQATLNIVQDFIPVGASNRPGTPMKPASITIHNTDNDSPGANAAAHAKYMKGADAQKREVSWHFTVDDHAVYQSLPTNEIGWHAANAHGNATSIGIEICMNPELNVPLTYERAALLTAVLARRAGIQVPSAIFQHNHWSGKDCPRVLRHQPTGWQDFLNAVEAKFKSLTDAPAPDLQLTASFLKHLTADATVSGG